MKALPRAVFLLFTAFFFVFFPPFVSAHLEGGNDVVAGGYLVDFGYSPLPLAAGVKSVIAFNLANASSGKVVSPDKVWVRISTGEEVVFAGTFQPEVKHVVFTYVFPKPGNYAIDTTLNVANESIPASFNVTVQPQFKTVKAVGLPPDFYAVAATFFVLALVASVIVQKFSKGKKLSN